MGLHRNDDKKIKQTFYKNFHCEISFLHSFSLKTTLMGLQKNDNEKTKPEFHEKIFCENHFYRNLFRKKIQCTGKIIKTFPYEGSFVHKVILYTIS